MLIIKLRLVHVTLLSISYVLSKVVYNRREKSLVKMRIIRLMGLLGSLGSENEHKLSCNCLNFFFFIFLGLHLWHMDVPRLGVELQLSVPDLSHVCNHGNARSLTHRVKPGIKPVSSWILVRVVSAEPQRKL